MAPLIVLALILLIFGLGFVLKALWFVAVILLVAWAVGFLMRGAESRWYRW